MDFSQRLINNYQTNANKTLALVCRWVALLMFLIGALNYFGVFSINSKLMYLVIALAIAIALLPTLIFNVLNINKVWGQYLVLTSLVIMSGVMYMVLSYHSIIMLVFPLVCSCLYSKRKLIIYTIAISVPMIVISHLIALDLNIVPDEPLITLHGTIFYGIIPRVIQFIAIGIICVSITDKIRALIDQLIIKNNDLYEDQQTLIESLSELVEAQSQETGQHVKRVAEYTKILCKGLGFEDEKTWMVSIASMMHDIGKLLVPSEIIEKPGKLTAEEFEEIKKHVDYGKKMLEKSPGEVMQVSSVIAYQHHEKWDGSGYNHLKGEEISVYARCTAIADVFDALVSRRPYKEPWTSKQAYDEIVSQRGKHFDPVLVDIFMEHFSEFEAVMEKYPESRDDMSISDLLK